MDTRTLIDGIVRQTTILIAQLSTAAGIRAPLAHVADQVFIDLAREIERQGVRQKVVADMFGVALRTYQKKVQRLAGSADERNRTLWEAVVAHIAERGRASRSEIDQRFRREDAKDVAAVLNDLVDSGLVYATGSGGASVYGLTTALDREALQREGQAETASDFVWLAIFRGGPVSESELRGLLSYPRETIRHALDALVADGRIERLDEGAQPQYRTGTFNIPVGASQGWEAAVFDHYQAVSLAIAAKVSKGELRSQSDDVVGGATLRFDVSRDHPLRDEVLRQLARVRAELNELWERVEAHNAQHPIAPGELEHVAFYFGQHARDASQES